MTANQDMIIEFIENERRNACDPTRERDISKCHDCGVTEGHIHERRLRHGTMPTMRESDYFCGCPREMNTRIEDMPNRAYPISAIRLFAAGCGKLWPDLYTVPDEEWHKYIQIDRRDTLFVGIAFENQAAYR